MTQRYALITRDLSRILKFRTGVTPVPAADLHPDKPYWVPVRPVTIDDRSTGPDRVKEPVVRAITATEIVCTQVIRDETPAERDGRAAAQLTAYPFLPGLVDELNRLRTEVAALRREAAPAPMVALDLVKAGLDRR